MNIKEAKQQIKNTAQAYFTKEDGQYLIPFERQRPLFLSGPPGIGKTSIMAQIADEMGVGFLSYSMTHHTRQSALGLPYIVEKEYKGQKMSVSEYTVSEIIGSVYDMIEDTGIDEGILFLDEINCVSETLTPVMLQFLQYKVFGRHRLPEGWMIVTAGNPVAYNRSAREFDVVTMDRLKVMDIEPDFEAWKEYSLNTGAHAVIINYLELHKDHFYSIAYKDGERSYVTARGWSDLSDMIQAYEKLQIDVDEEMICQYIHDNNIADSFYAFFELYQKYKKTYPVLKILNGEADDEIFKMAENASFDERLTVLKMLEEEPFKDMASVMQKNHAFRVLYSMLKSWKENKKIEKEIEAFRQQQYRDERRGILTKEKRKEYDMVLSFLDHVSQFDEAKIQFQDMVSENNRKAEEIKDELQNLFFFVEKAWNDGPQLLILVTDMTVNENTALFLAKYGCDSYFKHYQNLNLEQSRISIQKEIMEMETI